MVLPLPLQICKLKTQKEPKTKMVINTHVLYTKNLPTTFYQFLILYHLIRSKLFYKKPPQ